MPNFDRSTLAKFLPDPRAIAAFEALNKAVDVTLPNDIEDANGIAQQALINAQQALTQLVEVFARVEFLEIAPAPMPSSVASDNLAPMAISPSQPDDISPLSIASGPADDISPHYI